jgi:hypothetical protein
LICRDNTINPIEETTEIADEVQSKMMLNGIDEEETDEESQPGNEDPINNPEDPVEEVTKTYKAKMALKLNDYYLKQMLSGYDIATNQSKISIDDYRTKIAN